jgi:hypothetical protein
MKYRLGKKQKRAILDIKGNEIMLFPPGREDEAEKIVNLLNDTKELEYYKSYFLVLRMQCIYGIIGKFLNVKGEKLVREFILINNLHNLLNDVQKVKVNYNNIYLNDKEVKNINELIQNEKIS